MEGRNMDPMPFDHSYSCLSRGLRPSVVRLGGREIDAEDELVSPRQTLVRTGQRPTRRPRTPLHARRSPPTSPPQVGATRPATAPWLCQPGPPPPHGCVEGDLLPGSPSVNDLPLIAGQLHL